MHRRAPTRVCTRTGGEKRVHHNCCCNWAGQTKFLNVCLPFGLLLCENGTRMAPSSPFVPCLLSFPVRASLCSAMHFECGVKSSHCSLILISRALNNAFHPRNAGIHVGPRHPEPTLSTKSGKRKESSLWSFQANVTRGNHGKCGTSD